VKKRKRAGAVPHLAGFGFIPKAPIRKTIGFPYKPPGAIKEEASSSGVRRVKVVLE